MPDREDGAEREERARERTSPFVAVNSDGPSVRHFFLLEWLYATRAQPPVSLINRRSRPVRRLQKPKGEFMRAFVASLLVALLAVLSTVVASSQPEVPPPPIVLMASFPYR